MYMYSLSLKVITISSLKLNLLLISIFIIHCYILRTRTRGAFALALSSLCSVLHLVSNSVAKMFAPCEQQSTSPSLPPYSCKCKPRWYIHVLLNVQTFADIFPATKLLHTVVFTNFVVWFFLSEGRGRGAVECLPRYCYGCRAESCLGRGKGYIKRFAHAQCVSRKIILAAYALRCNLVVGFVSFRLVWYPFGFGSMSKLGRYIARKYICINEMCTEHRSIAQEPFLPCLPGEGHSQGTTSVLTISCATST